MLCRSSQEIFLSCGK